VNLNHDLVTVFCLKEDIVGVIVAEDSAAVCSSSLPKISSFAAASNQNPNNSFIFTCGVRSENSAKLFT
jgi:hypothetical protein